MQLKPTFTALAMALLATLSAPAAAQTYDATVAAKNPLAHYTFESSVGGVTTDAVNGRTLELRNGATVASSGGPVINGASAGALVLPNGSGGTAFATSGGANPLLGGIDGAGSVVAWINLASLPSTQGRIFSIAGESEVGNDFDFQINQDNFLNLYTDGGSATRAAIAFDAGDLGQWLFVAGTFTEGGPRDLYIGGALSATSTAGSHNPNSAPFYVGQSNVFGNRYFDGAIAKVAVFDYALSASDIADLSAAAVFLPTGGVPEPATWALLILGFGATGAAMRRRTTTVAFA